MAWRIDFHRLAVLVVRCLLACAGIPGSIQIPHPRRRFWRSDRLGESGPRKREVKGHQAGSRYGLLSVEMLAFIMAMTGPGFLAAEWDRVARELEFLRAVSRRTLQENR